MGTHQNSPPHLDALASEVLARIAHEMRQPLSAVTAAVTLITRGDEARRHARACDVLARQCTRLSRLLEDLIVTAQVGSEVTLLTHDQVDLGRLVLDVADSFAPLLVNRDQQLDIDLPAQPCFVSGDRIRLEQVLSNIITNAMKYTDQGGRLSVSVAAAGRDLRVTVTDNGRGIVPEMLPHVFEMFATGGAAGHGLGVGLAVARHLVGLHGGTIAIASEGLGRGTEVVVRLPRLTLTGITALAILDTSAAATRPT
jgi:signal transduction histidine kinase